jgi:tRNA A37 methylthiotransferase MiaB
MNHRVSGAEQDLRSRDLRARLKRSRAAFLETCVGTPARIVVESKFPAEGVAANYVRIRLDTEQERNSWCRATITGVDPSLLFCIGKPSVSAKAF